MLVWCKAPVAGALVNKFGCRPVAMFGAVMSATGFAMSTMSANIDIMMLTYGIVGGMSHTQLANSDQLSRQEV